MYKFIKTKDPDNKFDIADVTMEIDAADRQELIEEFIHFLKACGYNTTDLEEDLLL